MTDYDELVREHPEAVAALPSDDPLRIRLQTEIAAGRVDAAEVGPQEELDREAAVLRKGLRDSGGMRRDLEATLLAIPASDPIERDVKPPTDAPRSNAKPLTESKPETETAAQIFPTTPIRLEMDELEEADPRSSAHDPSVDDAVPEIVRKKPRSGVARAFTAGLIAAAGVAAGVAFSWAPAAKVTPLADMAQSAAVGQGARGHAGTTGSADVPVCVETTASALDAKEKPTLIAVCLWSSSCGACEKLALKYETVKSEFETDGKTLFVRFDFSTDESQEQSRMLAGALGLSGIFEDHVGWSGIVLLVDPATRKIVGKLTSTQSEDDMRNGMMAALSL